MKTKLCSNNAMKKKKEKCFFQDLNPCREKHVENGFPDLTCWEWFPRFSPPCKKLMKTAHLKEFSTK